MTREPAEKRAEGALPDDANLAEGVAHAENMGRVDPREAANAAASLSARGKAIYNAKSKVGKPPKIQPPAMPVTSTKPMTPQLRVQPKIASLEQEYLQHLRESLLKMSSSLASCRYSKEDIERITSSSENFEKAAALEARDVLEGIFAELRKEGHDESFIEGFKKEAGLLDFLKLAPTILKNPLQSLRAGAKVLGAGEKVTADALHAAKGGRFGGIVNAAGDVVTHSPTMPSHLPGARTHAFADTLEHYLGGNISPNAQTALNNARTSAAGRMSSALGEQAQNAFQTHMFDVSNQARQTGAAGNAARNIMKDVEAGNFSHFENKMGLKPGQLQGEMSPDVLRDAATHAKDINANGASAGSYNAFMNPAAAAGGVSSPGHFRFTPGKGLSRGFGGAMLGSMFGPMGTAVGGGLGLATGTLGTGGAALAGGLGLGTLGYAGAKGLGALGSAFGGSRPDSSGLPSDRNRAVPFMSNTTSGGIGGALLGSLIANEMGLQGPASWILPLIGGVAGYHYLPQMMNRYKDPYGAGVNQIAPNAALYNQQFPLVR
jgi:hypothetical protein